MISQNQQSFLEFIQLVVNAEDIPISSENMNAICEFLSDLKMFQLQSSRLDMVEQIKVVAHNYLLRKCELLGYSAELSAVNSIISH